MKVNPPTNGPLSKAILNYRVYNGIEQSKKGLRIEILGINRDSSAYGSGIVIFWDFSAGTQQKTNRKDAVVDWDDREIFVYQPNGNLPGLVNVYIIIYGKTPCY